MRMDGLITEALERTGDGALIVGRDGRVVLWNRAAERLLGWSRGEALGRSSCEMLEGGGSGGGPVCIEGCVVTQAATKAEEVPSFDVLSRTKAGRPIRLNVSTLSLSPGSRSAGPIVAHLFREVPAGSPGLTTTAGTGTTDDSVHGLTPRELEVLRLVATGANTRTAAERLGVSPATIRNHVQNLLGKLGVHSRLQAVAYATTHRLL
jgi:PAS domain S-box-containing protein